MVLGVLGAPRLAWASGMEHPGAMLLLLILFVGGFYPLCAVTSVATAGIVYLLVKHRREVPSARAGIWARRFGMTNVVAAIIVTVGALALYHNDLYLLMVLAPILLLLGFLGVQALNLAKRAEPTAAP